MTEPLVLILDVAYALGFLLRALAILTPWIVVPSEATMP